MNETSTICRTTWIRTDRPVIPTNTADWRQLLAVQGALQQGVFAIMDLKRPEFYDIEIERRWYYIHIPTQIGGVYLIAAWGKASPAPDLDEAVPADNLLLV